jgi:hypothetical protein
MQCKLHDAAKETPAEARPSHLANPQATLGRSRPHQRPRSCRPVSKKDKPAHCTSGMEEAQKAAWLREGRERVKHESQRQESDLKRQQPQPKTCRTQGAALDQERRRGLGRDRGRGRGSLGRCGEGHPEGCTTGHEAKSTQTSLGRALCGQAPSSF